MSGWDKYLEHMLGLYSVKKSEWIKKNCGTMAAIFGDDGTVYAKTPNFPALNPARNVEIEDMTGNKQTFTINEFDCLKNIAVGNRNPSQAGAQVLGQKFQMTNYD